MIILGEIKEVISNIKPTVLVCFGPNYQTMSDISKDYSFVRVSESTKVCKSLTDFKITLYLFLLETSCNRRTIEGRD